VVRPSVKLPDIQSLTAALSAIQRAKGSPHGRVDVLERRPNEYNSSFPTEKITIRTDNGNVLRLFCKYGHGFTKSGHGHRGGVPYEALVYRHVLQPVEDMAALFYGSYVDEESGETWLVLLDLDKSVRVSKAEHGPGIGAASRWLGHFHTMSGLLAVQGDVAFLNDYDAGYYRGWADRTLEYSARLHDRFPWLPILCRRFEEFASSLAMIQKTIIHGEFTGRNVLVAGGSVYPVDWESAAVGFGEIDLACLTEGWPAELVRRCEHEYNMSRWPSGSCPGFEWRMAAAKLYLQFRWLGDRVDWTLHKNVAWRFNEMRSAAEQLGLL